MEPEVRYKLPQRFDAKKCLESSKQQMRAKHALGRETRTEYCIGDFKSQCNHTTATVTHVARSTKLIQGKQALASPECVLLHIAAQVSPNL